MFDMPHLGSVTSGSLSRRHLTPILHLLAGVEEVISQEPDITDPKCGLSNMNIPTNRIHLVGVPGLKSKIFNYPILPLAQNQKKFCARVDPRV